MIFESARHGVRVLRMRAGWICVWVGWTRIGQDDRYAFGSMIICYGLREMTALWVVRIPHFEIEDISL